MIKKSNNGFLPSSVFATDGNLVFSLTEYKNIKLLDIRKYYRDKITNDFLPTTKGISITRNTYDTIKNILKINDDKIKEWLSSQLDDDDFLLQQKKQSEKIKKTYTKTKSIIEKWRSPEFFEVRANGGENIIVYNENHPFFKNINMLLIQISKRNSKESKEIKTLIDKILSCFIQAKNLLNTDSKIDLLLNTLMYNWGMILSNALKNKDE